MSTWHLIASCLLLTVVAVHGRTTIPPPTGCIDSTWNVSDNTNVLGGIPNPASSVDACKAACTANTSCLGFDWDPVANPMCWWTGAWSGTWRTGTAPGVTHYQIIQRGSCPPGPVCATTWNAIADKNVRGGTYVPGVTTLGACQQACLASASCVGIDWDPGNPSQQMCWLSPSTTLSDAPGVTHYTPVTPPADQCATTKACVLMLGSGGVLATDRDTNPYDVYVSDNIFKSVVFNQVPCLDKTMRASYNNCYSYAASDGTGYLRAAVDCKLHLSQPNVTIIDRYPDRFAQDTSFLRTDDPSGTTSYFSLETAAAIRYYVNGSSVLKVDSLIWSPPGSTAFSCVPPTFQPLDPPAAIKDSCPLVWAKFDESNVVTPSATYPLDLLDCARACITRPKCAGISFRNVSATCDVNRATPCQQAYPICNLIDDQPATAVYTQSDETFTYYEVQRRMTLPCDRGCLYTWKYTSTLAGEGPARLLASNIDTDDVCRTWCINYRQNLTTDPAKCVGVVFSLSAPQKCRWFSSLTGGSDYGYALTRVYDRCGVCINSFATVINATDTNAKSVGTADNDGCRTACINNPLCRGYEIRDGNNCYLSLSAYVLTYPSPYRHSDIIRALPICGNGCLFKWRLYTDTSMTNGTGVSIDTASNEKACREKCQNRLDCTAVDWTASSTTCWLALSGNVQKNYGTTPGTTHFELSREKCA